MEGSQNSSPILEINVLELTQSIKPDLFLCNARNPHPKTNQGTNIFFLGSKNSKILIDTGNALPAFEECFSKIIKKDNITITTIIITHYHLDHTEGLSIVLKYFPKARVLKLRGGEESSKIDVEIEKRCGFKYESIKDGELIVEDDYKLNIVHVPGHTDDSIAIYEKERKWLFVGDTVLGFGSGTFVKDLIPYMNSLKKLMNLDFEILLPAHGSIFLDKSSAMKQIELFYQNRIKREEQVKAFLLNYGETSFETLFDNIYPNLEKGLQTTAKINLNAQLEKLIKEDILEFDGKMFKIKI